MNGIADKLNACGDYFTAGFMTHDDGFFGAPVSYLDNAPLPEYTGSELYPLCSVWRVRGILNYHYSSSVELDGAMLNRSMLDGAEKKALLDKYGKYHEVGSSIADRYALSGRGFTHYCPEPSDFFECALPEYFSCFEGDGAFREKMRSLGGAVVGYVRRIAVYLESFAGDRAKRLACAYRKFLSGRVDDFFDAFVRIVFVFALDGMDSLGNVDLMLSKYKRVGGEEKLFSELYEAYENNNAWNLALGLDPETAIVALNGFDGASRPNFSIKVDENTPASLWNACFDAMARGARPAFYNRRGYESEMAKRGVERDDIKRIAYGGCSETLVSGKSNVGSVDAGLDFLHVLSDILSAREYDSYEKLYGEYLNEIRNNLKELVHQVNAEMTAMRTRPQYIRSLLCPSCGASGKEYNDGGAKYTFSVIHFCALGNAVDSLYALKKLVFEQKLFSYGEVKGFIDDDFNGGEKYLRALDKLDFFGNDNAEIDIIAAEIFDTACAELEKHKTAIGNGEFLPACIMFNTAMPTGRMTKATPDGRRAFAPVANSGGSVTGRDKVSPTALLNSVAKINPMRAVGSWIVNITLSESFVKGDNARAALKALILTYMNNGGCQLQINLTDKTKLCAAVDDDELAKTIIVRVGGFSERFSNLNKETRKFIADRTQY